MRKAVLAKDQPRLEIRANVTGGDRRDITWSSPEHELPGLKGLAEKLGLGFGDAGFDVILQKIPPRGWGVN